MNKALIRSIETALAELATLERAMPADLLPHAELIRDCYRHLGELSNALTEVERRKIRRKELGRG